MTDALLFLPCSDVVFSAKSHAKRAYRSAKLFWHDMQYIPTHTSASSYHWWYAATKLSVKCASTLCPWCVECQRDPARQGRHCTSNNCKAWNNVPQHIVGHDHPSVWVAIECLHKDQALAMAAML